MDFYAIQKEIRVLADKAGLSLSFQEDIPAPCTNGREIIVPPFPIGGTADEIIYWRYSIYHEVRHNSKGGEIFDLDRSGIDKLTFHVLNIIEDFRIEYTDYDQYAGEKYILEKGRVIHMDKQLPVYGSKSFSKDNSEMESLIKAIFVWELRNRISAFQPSLGRFYPLAFENISDKAKEILDGLAKYDDELLNLRDANDSLELARKLVPPPAEEDKGKKDQTGDDPNGKDSAKQPGDVDGSGGTESGVDALVGELLPDAHDKKEKLKDAPVVPKYRREAIFVPRTEIQTVDFKKVFPYYKAISELYTDEVTKLLSQCKVGKSVRKLIQTVSVARTQHSVRKGKLDSRNLYRVGMKDSGSYQTKVFKTRVEGVTVDTSVSLLIDCSGSMQSKEKFNYAGAAAISMNEALAALRVPVEIAGFSDLGDPQPIHYMFKSFGENAGRPAILERLRQASGNLFDNSDGENILYAYHRLLQQPTAKKILVVLSDGLPSTSYCGGCEEFTKKVISSIEKDPRVEIYGIGVLSDKVTRYYSKCQVLGDIKMLDEVIMNLIKSTLIR